MVRFHIVGGDMRVRSARSSLGAFDMGANIKRLTLLMSRGAYGTRLPLLSPAYRDHEHGHGKHVDAHEQNVHDKRQIVQHAPIEPLPHKVADEQRKQRRTHARGIEQRGMHSEAARVHGACDKKQKVYHLEAEHRESRSHGQPR